MCDISAKGDKGALCGAERMIDHEEMILEALEPIPGLRYVGDSYPEGEAETPLIVVELASDRVEKYAGDKPYLVEMEYYLRIYGTEKKTMRRILAEADARMADIGYRRTFRYEGNSADIKLWTTRYKTFV